MALNTLLLSGTSKIPKPESETYKGRKYLLFCIGLAIAVLFDVASNKGFVAGIHLSLLSLAALFLIVKPSSLFRLLFFLMLLMYWAFKNMPYVSNHLFFNSVVALNIIMGILYMVLKNRSMIIDKGRLLDTFAPMIRLELIILYFYVVFHKLNSGFFSPEGSCAVSFMEAQLNFLPFTKELFLLNAYTTIFIEALIPVLLCFRRTRNLGLLTGLVFHFIIAFNPRWGFYDISSSIYAAYLLFVDRHFVDRVFEMFAKLKAQGAFLLKPQVPFRKVQLAFFIALFVFGFVLIHILTKEFQDYFRYLFWTAYSIPFMILFVWSVSFKTTRQKESEKVFTPVHWSLLFLPIIVFFNGMSPYLGLKTEASFAMFSNLRTEGGETNHFLIPAESQIFDFQKDLVEIISSSDPKLQEYANKHKVLVYFMFRHMVSEFRPERVEYIRNGQRETFLLRNAVAETELLKDNPFLARKLLFFRPISKFNPQPCEH